MADDDEKLNDSIHDVDALRVMGSRVFARLYAFPHGDEATNRLIEMVCGAKEPRITLDQSEREGTPSTKHLTKDESDYDDQPYIELSLDNMPKSDEGVIFGRSGKCDIRLPYSAKCSARQCCITFDNQRRLIVRDLISRNGTEVTYSGEGTGEPRRDFRWIIGGDKHVDDKVIILRLSGNTAFRIFVNLALLDNIRSVASLVDGFCAGTKAFEDDLAELDVKTSANTAAASGTQSPHLGDLYLSREIGSGAFGVVTRRWNVSTGEQTALKKPNPDRNHDHDSLRWKSEIRAMKTLKHENIVPLLESNEDALQLIMPYYPLMSLHDNLERLTSNDKPELLKQCLAGLKYAHGKGIVHRDIKPENILIESLLPLKIRLADFGEAKDESFSSLKTFCGTGYYMAPEIFSTRHHRNVRYTQKCDIWSLGVVISETIVGIFGSGWYCGVKVCSELRQNLASKAPRSRLANLLLSSMLVIDSKQRKTAEQCYELAMALPLVSERTGEEDVPQLQPWVAMSADRLRFSGTERDPRDVETVRLTAPGTISDDNEHYSPKSLSSRAEGKTWKRRLGNGSEADQGSRECKRQASRLTRSINIPDQKSRAATDDSGVGLQTRASELDRRTQTKQRDEAATFSSVTSLASSHSVVRELQFQLSRAESAHRHAVASSVPNSPVQRFIQHVSPVLQSIEWPVPDSGSQRPGSIPKVPSECSSEAATPTVASFAEVEAYDE